MPIFEYQCQGCGHVFEKVQVRRQEAHLPSCPVCQTPHPRQLISRFSSPSAEGQRMVCAPSAVA